MTSILNAERSLIAFIDMEKLGEKSFSDFGIAKTDTLLSVVDAIPDSCITLENEKDPENITIENSKTTQKIRKSSPNLFQEAKPETISMIRGSFDTVIDIELKKEDLKDLVQISRMLSLDTLVLKDNKMISGRASGNDMEDESITSIEGTFDSDNGSFKLDLTNLAKLPQMDYKLTVYHRQDDNIKVAFLEPDTNGVLVIISEKL
jgi:hypothetical protein